MSLIAPRAGWATTVAGLYASFVLLSQPTLPMNMRVVDLLFPLLVVLVLSEWHRSDTISLTTLDWCVVAIVLALVPSLLVTPDLRASLAVVAKRVYVAVVFGAFGVYFKCNGVRDTILVLVRAAVAISVACLLAAVAYMVTGNVLPLIGQPNPLPYVGSVLRVWGGADSAEMFGNYLTMAWPLACAFAIESRFSGWWVSALVVLLIAMGLSFSHALVGFVAATVFVTWPLPVLVRRRPGRWGLAVVACGLGVIINLMLVVTVRDIRWTSDFNLDVPSAPYLYAFQPPEGANRTTVAVSYNPMSYYLLKKVAWEAFLEHPWAGVGAGSFHRLTERAYAAGHLHSPYRAIDPHSTLFGALAETGLPGALAAIALFWAALSARPSPGASPWLVRGLQAGVLGIAVNSINADVLHFRFLWIGLAALRALI